MMGIRLHGTLIALVVSCFGCQSATDSNVMLEVDCGESAAQIEQLEQKLFALSDDLVPDQEIRSQLMGAYASFANACHDDARTAEMLFRRSDLLRSAGKFQEAMTQLRDVHDHFPEYEKRALCAFLVGFIAEEELNDREQAKKTYEQVIALHDSTNVADWARQSLLNLEATTDRRHVSGKTN